MIIDFNWSFGSGIGVSDIHDWLWLDTDTWRISLSSNIDYSDTIHF